MKTTTSKLATFDLAVSDLVHTKTTKNAEVFDLTGFEASTVYFKKNELAEMGIDLATDKLEIVIRRKK